MNNASSLPDAFEPEQAAELDRLSALVSNDGNREAALRIADEGNAEVAQAYESEIAHMQEAEGQLNEFTKETRASMKEEEQAEHASEMAQAESIDFNA